MSIGPEITALVARAHAGDRAAEGALFEEVYPHLRQIARQRLSREAHAQQATESIVHECFLRLMRGQNPPEVASRAHFFALSARLMRQILVDHARARLAGRRDRRRETSLDEAATVADRTPDLLRLDTALTALAQTAPRQAQLIELRFFGGLTAEESAACLGIPVPEVRRGLRFAQSWLKRELDR